MSCSFMSLGGLAVRIRGIIPKHKAALATLLSILCLAMLQCGGGSGEGGASVNGSDHVVGSNPTTLAWDPPSRKEVKVAGYRLYYGRASRSYSQNMTLSKKDAYVTVDNLARGAWFFSVTTIDEKGNESAFSNEVVKEII